MVELAGVGQQWSVFEKFRIDSKRLQNRVHTLEPAGRHRGRVVHPQRACKNHFFRAEALREVMRRKPDRAFQWRKAKSFAHGARHPWIHARIGRPGVFVQSGKNHDIGLDKTRLELAEYHQAWMQPVGGAHGHAGHAAYEKGQIFRPGYRRQQIHMFAKICKELRCRIAILPRP